ncbi:peptidyl-prolyl cis-trans isomerase [Dendrothele bispora CBS 962.96]|uniref:peptidylprolyl isomerase n=1 Tax=Dendrothele bispora (strain CBS 962.96) TaxID=1314807 RepID=A0A4S8MNJ1_DENBC|nr:peptidyl-prolyl cis-trans isomerase [Dendrothele bispora CBS 962.96]
MGVTIERIFSGNGRDYPESGDIVSIHYVGKLNDGSTFDSTYDRGRPFIVEIGIGKVIQGWDNGVPQLSKGEKVLMTVPPELAYGERGVPPIIPPNSTLKFEMELIDIVRPSDVLDLDRLCSFAPRIAAVA